MSYRDSFAFRPRKKSQGVYFNPGSGFSFSLQKDKGAPCEPKLELAIQSAFRAFWFAYYGVRLKPRKPNVAANERKAC